MLRTMALCAVMIGPIMGCASVPMASLEADSSAKQFQVKKGASNVYLYRHETFGSALAMTVSLDGQVMGKTGPHTFFLWEVSPGRHEIQSHTENTPKFVIDAKEGQNHYVWQEVKMGLWQPASRLHEVDEAEGRKRVLQSKRVIPE